MRSVGQPLEARQRSHPKNCRSARNNIGTCSPSQGRRSPRYTFEDTLAQAHKGVGSLIELAQQPLRLVDVRLKAGEIESLHLIPPAEALKIQTPLRPSPREFLSDVQRDDEARVVESSDGHRLLDGGRRVSTTEQRALVPIAHSCTQYGQVRSATGFTNQ